MEGKVIGVDFIFLNFEFLKLELNRISDASLKTKFLIMYKMARDFPIPFVTC